MKIPNANNAVADIRKLREYCLSPDHPRGKHKARVFESVLGITRTDAEFLRSELLLRIQTEECEEVESDPYGRRYFLDFLLRKGDNEAVIRSNWMIRSGEDFPRLTSCFVK